MRSAIAIIAGAAVLALIDLSIAGKERHLESGRVVYLELAPVDPRSLMQGDYMALRFRIANDAQFAMPRSDPAGRRGFFGGGNLAPSDGRIVAALDARSVASFRRLDDKTPPAADEVLLRYRVREGTLKFATNAYFFQEGTGKRFERARYGEFRVAPDGEVLLTGLRGAQLELLK